MVCHRDTCEIGQEVMGFYVADHQRTICRKRLVKDSSWARTDGLSKHGTNFFATTQRILVNLVSLPNEYFHLFL